MDAAEGATCGREEDGAQAASKGGEIRGRGRSPGPVSEVTGSPADALGLRSEDTIRGPLKRPGPTGARVGSATRMKPTELEAWLQRSRAERAARTSGRSSDEMRRDVPTAAERMAALRRRISARAAGGGGAAEDSSRDACMGPTSSTASIEDGKIHFYWEGRIRGDDPPSEPVAIGAAGAEVRADGGGSARAAVPSSDAVHAARRVAWHAVGGGQLTDNRGAG